jgi:amino acid transporter
VTQPPPARTAEPLPRELSVLGLWLLVVNGMIGAGIFGLPAEAARLAGDASPWIFVICAVLILPVVLSFAQLASHFGNTGGPMLYAATAFGPLVGFQVGWAYYVARLTAFSANLSLLVATLGYFWPAAADARLRALLLFACCALLVAINVVGARDAMRSLGLLTALKFLPLVLVVGFGIAHVDAALLTPQLTSFPGAGDLGAAILLVIYAYVGFESGLVPAGEARRPERDMPRALLAALATVSLLYAAVQMVSVAVLPDLATASRPLVAVGETLLGSTGALLVMAGIAVSVGGNLLGSMFSTPRVTYRLARDGHLPAWFGAVHARHQTPAWSIAFYGLLGFLLALKGSFAWLAALSVLVRILLYLCCIAAVPRVRARLPVEGGLRLPGGLAIPGLGVVVCLGLLTQVDGRAWVVTAVFLGAGSVLYLIARNTRRP